MKRFLCMLCCGMLLSVCALAENELYAQTGTLPVYRAVTRSSKAMPLYDQVQPEWFNQSGEPSYKNWSRRDRYDHYRFPDGGELNIAAEDIDYREYDGTMETIPLESDAPVETLDKPTLKCSIGELAMGARQCWPKLDSQPQLEQTRLGRLTLEDAQTRMETLLAQIGLTGYQCVYALDMSVERIYDLGEKFRKGLDSSNVPLPAFETATEKDEGFYLYYEKFLDRVSLEHERQDAGQFSACAYITAEGLHLFHLRDSHVIGDVYDTPDRLLTADEARAAFEKGNPKRQRDGFQNAQAVSLTLTYRPIRAPQKKDGVVLSPAWLIEYTFSDGGQNDGYAWYSATDGHLIADCYSR